MTRQALGRGLRALIPEAGEGTMEIRELPVDRIQVNPYQPRQQMDPEGLEELAESIRTQGVIQPLVVRPVGDGYQLVVGERRWRAAQMAGLEKVPVVVRSLSDREAAALALVENLQREGLNPIEEAMGYRRLMLEFGWTQEEVASQVGRSRSGVANALRLLQLAPEVQDLIMSGQLSAGHGKVLAAVEKVPEQLRLAQQAVKEGWSVRHLEQVVAALKRPRTRQRQRQPLTPEAAELQSHLAERLGTRVTVRSSGKRGKIEIEFFGLEDLERIVRLLLGEE
ncbi:ParB/RepB/Spo0J family partition protein [Limnochorda sp.]|uniref:ParB/RepB/Spo0J family partition protein n=1 Tax=Limnochorda sp. TaxID=1940279 RepID=UPI0018129189|nr:chromosome partitioning protein ParB [Bacillota bacterium]MBO2519011.1 chromosome partitioning protein ParB [Bacillota bacterium]NMA70362.1 ParB/RepB/Spo0J family partition protein [Bacillota bacterium]